MLVYIPLSIITIMPVILHIHRYDSKKLIPALKNWLFGLFIIYGPAFLIAYSDIG